VNYGLDLPDRYRVAQVLMYTGPDGRRYIAPLGTPAPDPDRALDPAWTEIKYVHRYPRDSAAE